MRNILFLFLLLFSITAQAQTDSLDQAIRNATSPKQRFELLKKATMATLFSAPEKCEEYTAESIRLAKELINQPELALGYRMRGVLYMEGFDHYDRSEKYLDSALALFTQLKDTFGIAKTLNNKGALNYYQSNREEATQYYKKALALFTAIHNETETANVLFNVGNMKMESGDYVSAREHFINFLKIAEKSGNIDGQSIAHINIGHTYFETGKYDSALPEFMTAIELAEKSGNLFYQVQAVTFAAHIFKATGFTDKAVSFYYNAHDLAFKANNRSIQANTLMGLADLYLDRAMKDSALYLVDCAYQVYEEASDDRGMATTFRFRGDLYKSENKPALAIGQYFKAMSYPTAMAYEIFKGNLMHLIGYCYADLYDFPVANLPDSLKDKSHLLPRAIYYLEGALELSQGNDQRVLQKNIHGELASIYETQGKFREAYTHYKKFVELKDSVFSEESTLKIAELESKHELDIRQKELALQKIQLASATKDKWMIAAGSVMLTGFLVWYIYRYRRMQKSKREQDMERVRTGISRDLHDEVGSTLSAIQFLTHSARKRITENQHEKAMDSIGKMQENATQVQDIMSDIVWNIKPESDKLENILARIQEYANTTFDSKGISFTFKIDVENDQLVLSPEMKNNIYRIFKEAVNNCVKHSSCTEASASIEVKGNTMQFVLKDNGKGMGTLNGKGGGNGLRNMKQRAAELGADFTIDSSDKGTTVRLLSKITSSGDRKLARKN